MTYRGKVLVSVALGATLALAGCGGGSASSDTTVVSTTGPPSSEAAPATTLPSTVPPTTETPPTAEASPTTSQATTTTEPQPEIGEDIATGDGFISMTVAPGWSVAGFAPGISASFEQEIGAAWAPSPSSLDSLVELFKGDVTFSIVREGRYQLVDSVFTWDSGVRDLLGLIPNISATTDWGGGRGNSTRGSLGTAFGRLDSTESGDQIVGALTVSPDAPTQELNDEIDEMLASIVIDPTVVDPLAHSIEFVLTNTDQDSGVDRFQIGVLAPPSWIEDGESIGVCFDSNNQSDSDPGQAIINVFDGADEFDAEVDREFTETANSWLAIEPVLDERTIDDVPFRIFWEGDPAIAEAAIAMGHDGESFVAVYIYTPGDTVTMTAIVDSIQITISALHPE